VTTPIDAGAMNMKRVQDKVGGNGERVKKWKSERVELLVLLGRSRPARKVAGSLSPNA
jgi:hypothetical protein